MSIRFLSSSGEVLDRPHEWEPCFIDVDPPVDDPAELHVRRNGTSLASSKRELGDSWRTVAEWPLSGAGNYLLEAATGSIAHTTTVRVSPAKISDSEFESLLDQLQSELPASIAIILDNAGALSGLGHANLEKLTIPEELKRLERSVSGVPAGAEKQRPGLANLLPAIQREPHRMLRKEERWVARGSARRPEISALARMLARPNNIDDDQHLRRIVDARVKHTVDLYENQVVRALRDQTKRRLVRLIRTCDGQTRYSAAHAQAVTLLTDLQRAERRAPFLDEVSDLRVPPSRPSMVLLRRPEYRAALEGYLEINRSLVVSLDDPSLEAPMENVPRLYEIWGFLLVARALLEIAPDFGFDRVRQDLVRRHSGSVFVGLTEGAAALELERSDGATVRLIGQRTYGAGSGLHSISFQQRPDVSVEIQQEGNTTILIFDPKYKLDSERLRDEGVPSSEIDGESDSAAVPIGRPKKVDIDKMHAYRDSIRDGEGNRVVRLASIMYPGTTRYFGSDVAALSAIPGKEPDVINEIKRQIGAQLGGEELPWGAN
jgi:hypothetical protein